MQGEAPVGEPAQFFSTPCNFVRRSSRFSSAFYSSRSTFTGSQSAARSAGPNIATSADSDKTPRAEAKIPGPGARNRAFELGNTTDDIKRDPARNRPSPTSKPGINGF